MSGRLGIILAKMLMGGGAALRGFQEVVRWTGCHGGWYGGGDRENKQSKAGR